MNQNARENIQTLSGNQSSNLDAATMTKARESWHVLGIMSEFVHSAEQLAKHPPAVEVFLAQRASNSITDTIKKQKNWRICYRMQVLA